MREVVEVEVAGDTGEPIPGDVPSPTLPVERPAFAPLDPGDGRGAPPMSTPLPATALAGEQDGRGFEVNPAVITGAAGVFDAEAAALVEGGTTAAARLATLGVAWGDDRVGVRFGSTYQPAAERVLHNVAALGAGLARIAAALRAVGASYQTVDDGIAAAVEAAARRLDPAATPSASTR